MREAPPCPPASLRPDLPLSAGVQQGMAALCGFALTETPFSCLGVLMCGYPDSFQARFYCLFQPSPVSSTQLPPERPDRDVPLYTSRKSLTFRCYNSSCFMEVVWGQRQEMRSPQLGTLIPRDSATPVKQTGHGPSLWSMIIHSPKLLQWFLVQFWLSQHSLEDSTISLS